MSYPATVRISGREIVLPEVASWSRPWAATIRNGRLEPLAELRVEGGRRVVDPTLIEHQGRLYLFGTLPDVGSSVLYLWTSESLGAPFEPHPESPVRLSPEGSRMGGAIIEREGHLVRLGQDFSRGYGDGLFAFEIEILTPQAYRERPIGRLAFSDRKGPHTLNVGDGALVFDWYVDRFSPLAGLRRLAARRRRQPPRVAAWSAPSTRS